MGLASLGDGIWALYRRGLGAVTNAGPQGHFLNYPWWVSAGAGVFVLAGSLWALARR